MNKRKGIVRSQPVTAFSTTGFAGLAFLSEGLPRYIAAVCAIVAPVIRFLDTHGGIKGLWERIWAGRS